MLNRKTIFSWWLVALFVLSPLGVRGADEEAGIAIAPLPVVAISETDAEETRAEVGEDTIVNEEEEESIFLRVRRDDNGEPLAMETSVVSYLPDDGENEGLVVDLIGAVHIGDESYYESLNDLFEQYDVLLYELVAAEDTRPEADNDRPSSAMGAFQSGIGNLLELSFQLECVDYSCDNFVHADMSPEAFAEAMRDRGDGWLQMYFRAVGQSIAAQSQGGGEGGSEVEFLFALFAPNRAARLKRLMAIQFEEGDMGALEGPDGSAIITDRNTKALEVLADQIEEGQLRIGIFYGAAHMVDFEQRLDTEFGLHRSEEKWLVAWDLTEE